MPVNLVVRRKKSHFTRNGILLLLLLALFLIELVLFCWRSQQKKILYHFFFQFWYRKRKTNGKKLKHISMKRIAELILFKCDKHLIRMQSPLSPPPLPLLSSIPLFIVWKKVPLLDLSVNACKHIYIVYIFVCPIQSLTEAEREREKNKYKQKMRPLHSAHSHTNTHNEKKVNLCALRDQFLLFRLY